MMQKHSIFHREIYFSLRKNLERQSRSGISCMMPRFHINSYITSAKTLSMSDVMRNSHKFWSQRIKVRQGELSGEEDDDLCPVECVKEFKTDEELLTVLEKAKETGSLVVVDFYKTACGSCRYIEQGFSKICKGAGDREDSVIFLKHNVVDEYDEQSEVAERLRIKAVPLFHFYKNGVLLEAFATRNKEKITEAIMKYSSSATRSA